jgi:hypothetical protein
MDIKPIKTDADYRATLREIEALMTAEPGKEGGSSDPFGNPTPNTQPPSDSTSTGSVSGN